MQIFKMEDYKLIEYNNDHPPFCFQCGGTCEIIQLTSNVAVFACLKKTCYEKALQKARLDSVYSFSFRYEKPINPDKVSLYPLGFFPIVSLNREFKDAIVEDLDSLYPTLRQSFQFCIDGKNSGFILISRYGVGKTHAMMAMIKEIFRQNAYNTEVVDYVLYTSENMFFQKLKSTFNNENQDTSDVLKKYQECKYLFFDDLGAPGKSEEGSWGKQMLFDLIDYRYANRMTTFFGSNFTIEQLMPKIGERITDRLKTWTSLIIQGESKRTAK